MTSRAHVADVDDAHPDPDGAPRAAAAARACKRDRKPGFVSALGVLVLGLAIAASLTWTAVVLDPNAERRLLLVETKQAALVIGSSIPATQAPLTTAAQIAKATNGSVPAFRRHTSALLGGPQGFLMASLWRVRDHRVTVLAWLGGAASERPSRAAVTILAIQALSAGTFNTAILHGAERRLAYTDAVRAGSVGNVAFAELALPRRSRVASTNAAFSELHYAVYVGREPHRDRLLATDFAGGTPTGDTARVTVPFGQTWLTLVAAAAAPLAGEEPARLPWILAILGVTVSALAALVAQRGVNRRRAAERDTNEIAILNHELSGLYAEQRTIAVTLQRSLLPVRTPDVTASSSPSATSPAQRASRLAATGTAWWPSTRATSPSSSATSRGEASEPRR